MTTYTWPEDTFMVDSLEPKVYTLSDESVSPMNGDIQTVGLPGSRWGWAMDFPEQTWIERSQTWGFFVRQNGREHRLRLWDLTRPQPLGSLPLNGCTVTQDVAQFASIMQISTGVPNCTLSRGDWLKLGNANTAQTIMSVDNAKADGAGVITFAFRHMLRKPIAAGTVVVLDKPKALYVLKDSNMQGGAIKGANMASPWSVEIVEVFTE